MTRPKLTTYRIERDERYPEYSIVPDSRFNNLPLIRLTGAQHKWIVDTMTAYEKVQSFLSESISANTYDN